MDACLMKQTKLKETLCFLIQVEEIHPGYSKLNYVFLAKVSKHQKW